MAAALVASGLAAFGPAGAASASVSSWWAGNLGGLSQGYGCTSLNLEPLASSLGRSCPTDKRYWHQGVDISLPCGTPLVTPVSVTVVSIGAGGTASRGLGPFYPRLRMPDGTEVSLGHSRATPAARQAVGGVLTAGTTVALSGGDPGTGSSTGCHLHFQAYSAGDRRVDVDPNGVMAFATVPAPVTADPTQIVRIRSKAANRYVSAELGYQGAFNGMLRARQGGVGPWERYRLVGDCSVSCGIQSLANGRYVSAELGYSGGNRGMMRARATSIQGWERFRIEGDCATACGIKSLANGLYVSAELGYSGSSAFMLRARAGRVQGWEQFEISSDCGSDAGCAMLSTAANLYVSTELGFTGSHQGLLRARGGAPLTWERFTLVGQCNQFPGCGIRSNMNGLFVSAELGYPGSEQNALRARAGALLGWERFNITGDCGSAAGCALLSKAANRVVSVELGYPGETTNMLRARQVGVGPWESFRFRG